MVPEGDIGNGAYHGEYIYNYIYIYTLTYTYVYIYIYTIYILIYIEAYTGLYNIYIYREAYTGSIALNTDMSQLWLVDEESNGKQPWFLLALGLYSICLYPLLYRYWLVALGNLTWWSDLLENWTWGFPVAMFDCQNPSVVSVAKKNAFVATQSWNWTKVNWATRKTVVGPSREQSWHWKPWVWPLWSALGWLNIHGITKIMLRNMSFN